MSYDSWGRWVYNEWDEESVYDDEGFDDMDPYGRGGGYDDEDDGYDDGYDLGYGSDCYKAAPQVRTIPDDSSSIRNYRRLALQQTYVTSVNHDLQSYTSALTSDFQVAGLKEVCIKLSLSRTGKKAELVNKIALKLDITYKEGNTKKFNEMAKDVNEINVKHKGSMSSYRRNQIKKFMPMTDPDALTRMKEISRQKNYELDLPAGVKIEECLSEKIYLPAVPESSLSSLRLDFHITPDQQKKCQETETAVRSYKVVEKAFYIGVLFVRCYEDAPEGQPKCRVARGKYFTVCSLARGGHAYENYNNGAPIALRQFHHVPAGSSTVFFGWVMNAGKYLPVKPYIAQVVLLSVDRKATTQETAAEVKEKFMACVKKSDVMASSLTISLRCPLSFVRMVTPIRFKSCTHLQCIELTSWMAISKDKFSPTCPICNRSCIPSELIIDGFTQEILKETSEDVDSVSVDVENGCAWSTPRSSSDESLKLLDEKGSGTSTPLAIDEPVYIDLTADDTVYSELWVQPVAIKPDPGVPAEMLNGQLMPVVPQVRPSSDDPIDLTLDNSPLMNLIEVIEILE